MAEFSYNNTLSSSTGITPFYAIYGEHSRYLIQSHPEFTLPSPTILKEFAENLASLNKYLLNKMTWAQAVYSEQADKHRIPAPKFKVGDEVWLLQKNLKTTRPSSKLDFKPLGKFRIIKKVSSHTYKLKLPASMKVHPVFHVSLLESAALDPLPSQLQPLPPSVIIDEEPEWKVHEIVNSKFVGKTLRYLVQWVGYTDLTWELSTMLTNAPSAVKRFYQLYPSKPRPRNILT